MTIKPTLYIYIAAAAVTWILQLHMTAIKTYFHRGIILKAFPSLFALLPIDTDEFRSKLACENDNMPLMCNPYSRIAIYSASFGHTERESVQCGGQGSPAGSVMINREENGQPSKQCLYP